MTREEASVTDEARTADETPVAGEPRARRSPETYKARVTARMALEAAMSGATVAARGGEGNAGCPTAKTRATVVATAARTSSTTIASSKSSPSFSISILRRHRWCRDPAAGCSKRQERQGLPRSLCRGLAEDTKALTATSTRHSRRGEDPLVLRRAFAVPCHHRPTRDAQAALTECRLSQSGVLRVDSSSDPIGTGAAPLPGLAGPDV
jgi:hypothetical protein